MRKEKLLNRDYFDFTFSLSPGLSLGELLHDEMFGLFEAMSAIEMMDPKMDAGMRCNRRRERPHNFNSAAQVRQQNN